MKTALSLTAIDKSSALRRRITDDTEAAAGHAMPSWESWFDEHAATMVLFARQWTGCHADAEDVAQEAFVRFWKSGRYRATDAKAYLFACVKRAALDLARGEGRRRHREAAAGRRRGDAAPMFIATPEDEERRAAIESALAALPEEQRRVVVLKIWGELTFAEIGDVLELSPNTASSRYRYALQALRRTLSEEVVP